MKKLEARLDRAAKAFHSAVLENKITYLESVTLLCGLFVGFLEDVESNAGVEAKRGAILALSRVLSVEMGGRVLILEGDPPSSPGWMSDPSLDLEERKRRILELNAKMKKALRQAKAKGGK